MEAIKIFDIINQSDGRGRPRSVMYPFDTIKIGQGFELGKLSPKLLSKANNHCQYYGRKLKKKFSIRTTNGSINIIRIK